MRQRQLEEEKSRVRAIILSVCIHGLLFAYILYAVVELNQNMGSGFTEFEITSTPRKGTQTQELSVANAESNAIEQVKASQSTPKTAAPPQEISPIEPTPVVLPVENKTATDIPVVSKPAKKKPKKAAAKPAKAVVAVPTELPEKELDTEKEEADDFKNDLSALTEENKELPKTPIPGADKVDSAKKVAEYGDPQVVRSYKELTPMQGNRRPSYPNNLQRLGIEDTVVVDYYVLPDGRIRDIRVVKDSSHPEFMENVIKEVKNWRFVPGKTGYFRNDFVFTLNQPTEVIPERLRRRK